MGPKVSNYCKRLFYIFRLSFDVFYFNLKFVIKSLDTAGGIKVSSNPIFRLEILSSWYLCTFFLRFFQQFFLDFEKTTYKICKNGTFYGTTYFNKIERVFFFLLYLTNYNRKTLNLSAISVIRRVCGG